MATRTEEYAFQSRHLLQQGRAELEQGDLVQASEELWGAAAQMAKSVAERRGWTHSGHRELFQVVNRVAHEGVTRNSGACSR